jgi:hypothetical protein
MVNAYKQREKRDGIKMVWINLELPSEDENYLGESIRESIYAKNEIGAHHPHHKLERANSASKENCE